MQSASLYLKIEMCGDNTLIPHGSKSKEEAIEDQLVETVAVTAKLGADNHRQMWIPPGFAHGFLVMSETAEFQYKTTEYWYPEFERTLLWNDAALGIEWPLAGAPLLAPKDAAGLPLAAAES